MDVLYPKKHFTEKKNKRLEKAGFKPKKGTFKAFKSDAKKLDVLKNNKLKYIKQFFLIYLLWTYCLQPQRLYSCH